MLIRERSEQRETEYLSQFASLSSKTKGRLKAEKQCEIRTDYQRDKDRIIHSNSFRRLKHKTQVFLYPVGDHYRTRLTHTLEVAQVARTIARALDLNEDLTEAISLGHDIGHTPFGHTGEAVLNRLSPDGYKHSAQSVRVVELLENDGKGLNLTREVVDGIACHSSGQNAQTLEGQVVRYADKIAYMNHDIDDAVRAKVLREHDIPSEILRSLGDTGSKRITKMVTDLVLNSKNGEVKMSPEGQYLFDTLRSFLFKNVYTNSAAKSEEVKAQRIIEELYVHFIKNPDEMPDFYKEIQMKTGKDYLGVCDYIAGMSDGYCTSMFEKIFIPRPWGI